MKSQKSRIWFRILLDIILFFAVLNGWWFLAVPIGLIGVWLFPYFIEAIIAGVFYDSLFGYQKGMGLWGYAGTMISAALTLVVIWAKKTVRR